MPAYEVHRSIIIDAPKCFIGQLAAQDALKVTRKGRYEYLGNAWSTAINYARMKKIKTAKSPLGYEFYLNEPTTSAEQDLMTEVMLPIKKFIELELTS